MPGHTATCIATPSFLHGFWGSRLRTSCLNSKHFTHQAIFPVAVFTSVPPSHSKSIKYEPIGNWSWKGVWSLDSESLTWIYYYLPLGTLSLSPQLDSVSGHHVSSESQYIVIQHPAHHHQSYLSWLWLRPTLCTMLVFNSMLRVIVEWPWGREGSKSTPA